MENYKLFISEGAVSLVGDGSSSQNASLSGTFPENIEDKFQERSEEKAEKALMRNESKNVKGNIRGKQEGESKSVISRRNLIEEQSNDKELLDCE